MCVCVCLRGGGRVGERGEGEEATVTVRVCVCVSSFFPSSLHSLTHSLTQGAMKATFDALSRPPSAQLDPVDNSTLAQRRRNKKSSVS